jgi:hypothetical protein
MNSRFHIKRRTSRLDEQNVSKLSFSRTNHQMWKRVGQKFRRTSRLNLFDYCPSVKTIFERRFVRLDDLSVSKVNRANKWHFSYKPGDGCQNSAEFMYQLEWNDMWKHLARLQGIKCDIIFLSNLFCSRYYYWLLTVVAIFIGKFVFQPLVYLLRNGYVKLYIDCVKRG